MQKSISLQKTAVQPSKAESEFVNAKFLADRWDVTLPTIYNWARENRIPSVKCGRTVRFPRARALAAMEVQPAAV
jgi:excisionase family DNA binding protein